VTGKGREGEESLGVSDLCLDLHISDWRSRGDSGVLHGGGDRKGADGETGHEHQNDLEDGKDEESSTSDPNEGSEEERRRSHLK
jgi:hypothetical protein